MNKLILFDIDGTLIYTGGAGSSALNLAFYNLFGIQNAFEGIAMAGKTDMQIIKEGLKGHDFSHENGNLEKMKERYLLYLGTEIHNPNRRLKPGIWKILHVLREKGAVLGLLTGNLEQGAWIKLRPFGLNRFFSGGAFGSDHEDRNKLLPIALEKFSALGFNFRPRDCIIVGDTPRDVECAKVHGAFCIAVATGPYSRQDLSNTDADIVFDTLEESETCIDFINWL